MTERATSGMAVSGAGTSQQRILEPLDEAECLRLISLGGVGRIAYAGRFGPTVLPVNYKLHEQTIVFRTGQDSPMDEDLRTGIADAEYHVAFEIDHIDTEAREGWSVLIQGAVHHVDSEAERASVLPAGVQPWPSGDKEHFIRIIPIRVTGRRISRPRPGSAGADGRMPEAGRQPHPGGPGTLAASHDPDFEPPETGHGDRPEEASPDDFELTFVPTAPEVAAIGIWDLDRAASGNASATPAHCRHDLDSVRSLARTGRHTTGMSHTSREERADAEDPAREDHSRGCYHYPTAGIC